MHSAFVDIGFPRGQTYSHKQAGSIGGGGEVLFGSDDVFHESVGASAVLILCVSSYPFLWVLVQFKGQKTNSERRSELTVLACTAAKQQQSSCWDLCFGAGLSMLAVVP